MITFEKHWSKIMEFPNAKETMSKYQPYIRAAHKARSMEMYRLAGFTARGIGRAVGVVLSPLALARKALIKTLQARKAEKELAALDDRLLSDLGISRQDIKDVVRNGRKDPEPAPEKHPHEARRAAEVVELRREEDLIGALIHHGPWAHYADHRRKRDNAA